MLDYMRLPEHKFKGGEGCLQRADVIVDGVVYIGKEANNIDEQAVDVKRPQMFVNKDDYKKWILNVSLKEGEEIGINRGTLWRMKNKMRIISN